MPTAPSSANTATRTTASQCAVAHIFEQLPVALANTTLLLDTIRTLETRMLTRGLISAINAQATTPLWFLAETERNVFLWRRGISLADQEKLEFWVDLPKLIEKRIKSLTNSANSNTFPNSLLDIATPDDGFQRECAYLREFEAHYKGIAIHAHALSCIASQARVDLFGPCAHRPQVVLPVGA